MGSITVTVGLAHGRRGPVDVVRPEHEWIDDRLGAWGRWSRLHINPVRCGSAERAYRAPWRQWVYPSYQDMMPPIPNPELRQLDRAILRVPEGHRLALKLHYVFMARPVIICRKLALRHGAFEAFMRDARSMTLNNLRLIESKEIPDAA